MPVSKDYLPITGASGNQGTTAYTIDQSIRFHNFDTGYMKRTPSSSGNQRTWTLSMWVKRTQLGNYGVFGTRTGNTTNFFIIEFNSDDLFVQGYASGGQTLRFETTNNFRDVSAWLHLVFVADTTNAVASERIRIYVNGQRVTAFATQSYPAKDYDTHINSSSYENAIGGHNTGSDRVFSGYMADIVMLDGTAAGPSSFGELNSSGIWTPIDPSGLTFGTNGFYIDGRDASDLGDDESGQGNDYTTTGMAAHDQVLDTPTNNFAILNVTDTYAKLDGELRNGALELKDNSGSAYVYGRATFGFDVTDSDGWYWELCDIVEGSALAGITEYNTELPSGSVLAFTGARGMNAIGDSYAPSGHYKLENTTYQATEIQDNANAGDIIQFVVKNGKVFIGINNTFPLSQNPNTEANPIFTGLTGTFMPWGGLYSGLSYNTIYNFGQDGTFGGNKTAQGNTDANGFGNFFYAPPSGAKALCSRSLGA